MTFLFGHIIFSWAFGKAAELKKNFKLDRWAWFLLLFGSIFPDSDFFIDWTFNTHIHRTFSHSFLMIIAGFLLILLLAKFLKKFKIFSNLNPVFLGIVFSFGIFTHLIADMAMGHPGVPLFWPEKLRFWFFGTGAINYISLHFAELEKDKLVHLVRIAVFDMAIGVFWVGYLFFKKNTILVKNKGGS